MQAVGLLGLIITIALAAWWLLGAGPASVNEPADGQASYRENMEAAERAAELLSN